MALALTAGVLSACGTQGSGPTTSSTSLPAETTAAAESTSSPSSAGTTSETTEPEAITQIVDFTSPSGNVGCVLDPTYVRCDISERDWSPPPRPADCEFDHGQGIGTPANEQATIVCAGDTAMGGGEPLAYGKSTTKGNLTCDSAEAGITCRDSATGHAFTFSREAYKVF
jgi:hypothetical protein